MALVAACVSGRFRNFGAPCTGPLTVERIILPLRAHVYAFLNAPTAEVNQSLDIARRVLDGADVRALEVAAVDDTPSCSSCQVDGSGANNGYPQSRGLLKCAGAALHPNAPAYDWIFRLRPDTLIPYTFPSLPPRLQFHAPRGVVIAGAASECGCGVLGSPNADRQMWRREGGTCTRDTLCSCASDAFAMVHGREAQLAYFSGYATDFDTCARANHSKACVACVRGGKGHQSPPECKLGASLAYRGVPVYHVLWLVDPNEQPYWSVAIARGSFNCTAATAAPPLRIHPRALHAIPPGPWHVEAQAVQRAMCRLPPSNRSREHLPISLLKVEWEHLCSGRRAPSLRSPSP